MKNVRYIVTTRGELVRRESTSTFNEQQSTHARGRGTRRELERNLIPRDHDLSALFGAEEPPTFAERSRLTRSEREGERRGEREDKPGRKMGQSIVPLRLSRCHTRRAAITPLDPETLRNDA